MNKNHLKSLAILTFTGMLLTACGGGEKENNQPEALDQMEGTISEENVSNEEAAPTNQLVCIWDELSIREEPSDKGKYKTTIYLGEKAQFLEETKTDEASAKKNEYIKVKLSDGTEGWAQSRFMALDVTEFVTLDKATIYKRPDLLTATNEAFPKMLFVVSSQSQDGFYKVKGKPFDKTWFSEGWVHEKDLSAMEADLAFAKLYGKAMAIKDETKRQSEIEKIRKMEVIASSTFIAGGDAGNIQLGSDKIRDAYSCWLQKEIYTDVKRFPTIDINDQSLGMFSEGINGILYYNGMIQCLASYTVGNSGDIDVWGEGKYRIFKSMSGIEPTLKRGYDYSINRPSEHKFDHINPEFVNWAVNNMIPNPSLEIAGLTAQDVYNTMMRRFFRLHARAYFYVNSAGFAQEKAAYLEMMDNRENVYLVSALNQRYNDKMEEIFDPTPEDDYYQGLTPGIAAGFWVRRYMDGTSDEIWKGMEKGLTAFDAVWFNQEKEKWQ